MKQLQINSIFILGMVLMISASALFAHDSGEVKITDAWIRAAPPNAKILGAYLKIENHSSKPAIIKQITSSSFDKIEMHESLSKNGMAVMEQRESLSVPAQGTLELKPGGLHLMLFSPHKPLKEGDSVGLSFEFANGSKSVATAIVKKASGEEHQHHENHDHHSHDNHNHKSTDDKNKNQHQHMR